MAIDPKQAGMLSAMLSEFSTRINDLEERQNIITEKLTLLGQTLLNNTQRLSKEVTMINEEISAIKQYLEKIKSTTQILIEQSSDFVRKQEMQNTEKYMKSWEPMKYATIDDVKKLINDAVKNKKASSKDKVIKVEEEE
jgi:vacuolar-type H+-ATPase subunit I/STV1